MKRSIESKVHIASLLMFWVFSAIWQQFFIFNKTIYLPSWASYWPFPMYIGTQVAFISIAFIAMAEKNEDRRYKRVLLSPFVMPISAVLYFSLQYLNADKAAEYLASNIIFNYLYIALFVCLIPAIAVLALCEVFAFARRAVKKVVP